MFTTIIKLNLVAFRNREPLKVFHSQTPTEVRNAVVPLVFSLYFSSCAGDRQSYQLTAHVPRLVPVVYGVPSTLVLDLAKSSAIDGSLTSP